MKRTRLRPISAQRARESRRRAKTMTLVANRDRICQALLVLPGKCFGDLHGHELRKSSQGGSRTEPSNVVLLCDFHNGWIEDNPIPAHELGFVVRHEDELAHGVVRFIKWQSPNEVPDRPFRIIAIRTPESMSDEELAHSFDMPFLGECS